MAERNPKPPADDTTAFQTAVDEGLKSLDQGRGISYEKVRRWLLSWGTDKLN
jgi:predicted transcriptional regulator